MARKPMKRKIPFRARRLIREVLSGNHKTIGSAGKAAGYSCPSAAAHALQKLQGTIPELMDKLGLTDVGLLQNCLVPMLQATTTKHFQYKGKVIAAPAEKNWPARYAALDMA